MVHQGEISAWTPKRKTGGKRFYQESGQEITIEQLHLMDNRHARMVTSQNKWEVMQFSSVPANPFWGPASPLELQLYFPLKKYKMKPENQRLPMKDLASDFDLVTDIYDARRSTFADDLYLFRVFVKVPLNRLFFEVLARPLLIVNACLSILIFQDAVEYDILARVLLVQVFAYKQMRLEGVVYPTESLTLLMLLIFQPLLHVLLRSCLRWRQLYSYP